MAITGTIGLITTDFKMAIGQIASACTINVLRIDASISGGTDTGAYCTVRIVFQSGIDYTFRMINKDFNGTDGEFYFDFTDILPYLFSDISDDILESGVQDVEDTFIKADVGSDNIIIQFFDSNNNILDVIESDISFLFSAQQIRNYATSVEDNIFLGQMPDFLAQKTKQSYIYYYGSGTCTFEKVSHIPESVFLLDNLNRPLMANGKVLTYLK